MSVKVLPRKRRDKTPAHHEETCAECQRVFTTNVAHQRCCSPECSKAFVSKRRKKARLL